MSLAKSVLIALNLCVPVLLCPKPALALPDIVVNGNFEGGFYSDGNDTVPIGWTKLETGPSGSPVLKLVADNGPTLPGSEALDWVRATGYSEGYWLAARQSLNHSFQEGLTVILKIDIMAIQHNLGGSGWTSWEFEYPVTVKISYIDAQGISRYWQWGWYTWIDGATDPNPDHESVPDNGVVTGQQVISGQWVSNSFDLRQEFHDPATITEIIVGGAGWDYQGRADNIQMLVAVAAPEHVPNLTGWGTIVLAALLLSTSWLVIKRRKKAIKTP